MPCLSSHVSVVTVKLMEFTKKMRKTQPSVPILRHGLAYTAYKTKLGTLETIRFQY